MQVALALLAGADVDDEVEVVELEALRRVGVAQRRPHLRVFAHHREDLVHHLLELGVGRELRRGHQEAAGFFAAAAGFLAAEAGFLAAVVRDLAAAARGLAAVERDFAVVRAVPAAFAVGDVVRFLGAERGAAPRARRRGGGPGLELGHPAGERLDLRAQALEVLEHADVLDHLAHAAGRTGDLVDEVLSARPGGLRAVGRRLERALDSGAHRADGVGGLGLLLRLLLVLLRHCARKSSSIARARGEHSIHLRPNAPVAERALLPGDPGRALRLAQHLLAAPMQVLNTNRGLWGYTGTAADGAALTIQSTGMGGPSAAIVAEELIALGARRLVRVGTCGAFAVGARRLGDLLVAGEALCADGASRALGAGERAAADPDLTAALARAAGEPVTVVVVRPLLRPG